jgi:hypothetical protein
MLPKSARLLNAAPAVIAFCTTNLSLPCVTETSPLSPASNRRPIRHSESMIRKLPSGEFRLYSKKKAAKTGRRKNLGTFKTRAAAEKHERAVQYFKRAG